MRQCGFRILSGRTSWACDENWLQANAIVIVCLEGACSVTDQLTSYGLSGNTFAVHSPGPALTIEAEGVSIVISLTDQFDLGPGTGNPDAIPPLEAGLLMDVFVNHNRPDGHQQAAIDLFCHQLAVPRPRFDTPAEQESLVDRITDYLSKNLDAAITLTDVVNTFSMSKSYICKQFQDTVGASPMLVLARLRINRAKQLLADTQIPIAQVGYAVSYSTVSSFSHFFKKHTGVSPREYRENVRWLV